MRCKERVESDDEKKKEEERIESGVVPTPTRSTERHDFHSTAQRSVTKDALSLPNTLSGSCLAFSKIKTRLLLL